MLCKHPVPWFCLCTVLEKNVSFGKNKAPSLKFLSTSWWALFPPIPLPDGGASSFMVFTFKTVGKCCAGDWEGWELTQWVCPLPLWLQTVFGNDCMGPYLPRFISGFIYGLNRCNHSEILFSILCPLPVIIWVLGASFCSLLARHSSLVVCGYFEEAFCYIGSSPSRTY